MGASQEPLSQLTVDELRAQAREQGIARASDMHRDELVQRLARPRRSSAVRGSIGFGAWVRDRSLGIFFLTLFFAAWIAQLFFEWKVFADEQAEHGTQAVFWSANFWETFWQSTLENWQSEFLQVAMFAIAAAYLVYKGSSESPDSSERVEHKLDALLRERGLNPADVEAELPAKHRKTR